jgi:hypothetical protein
VIKSLQTTVAESGQTSSWSTMSPSASETKRGIRPIAGSLGSDRLGAELKTLYGELTAAPLPDRMVELADALEEAFRRGDLFDRRRCS